MEFQTQRICSLHAREWVSAKWGSPLGLEAHFGMEKGSFRETAFLCVCAGLTIVEIGAQSTSATANKNYRKAECNRSSESYLTWMCFVLHSVLQRYSVSTTNIAFLDKMLKRNAQHLQAHSYSKKAAVTSHGRCDKLRILGGHPAATPQQNQESHTIDFSHFSLCRASTMWQLIWKQNQKCFCFFFPKSLVRTW